MSKLELVNTTAFYLSAADRQHPDVDCGLVSFCCVKHEQRFEHNRVPFDMHLLLPLLAAIFFAIGSMVFKRAYDEGAGVVHAVVVNNVLLAIVFLPLFAFESRPVPWSQWSFPVLTGAAFAAGHLLNVLSLRVGDVSLATPLLGAKVIFVALLARLMFGWQLSARQWFAAALTTVGVFLMGLTDFKPGRRAGLTPVLAIG